MISKINFQQIPGKNVSFYVERYILWKFQKSFDFFNLINTISVLNHLDNSKLEETI